MISRRGFLRGLVAAPAVVAFGNLMPVRGVIMPIAPLPADLLKQRMREAYKQMRWALTQNLYGDAPGSPALPLSPPDRLVVKPVFPYTELTVPLIVDLKE